MQQSKLQDGQVPLAILDLSLDVLEPVDVSASRATAAATWDPNMTGVGVRPHV